VAPAKKQQQPEITLHPVPLLQKTPTIPMQARKQTTGQLSEPKRIATKT
jgi:hypothetical protein